MNKELLTALAKAIETLNDRISAIEEDCIYGRALISDALRKEKKTKAKTKKQSGASGSAQ